MTSYIVCVDANLVRLMSENLPDSLVRTLWQQLRESGCTIVAPALLYYELSNAFHRANIANQISPERASQFLEDALNLDIRLYSDAKLHKGL